jgi:MoxR-like ATPase
MSAIDFETQLKQRIGQVVFGADALVRNLAVALIAGGHVLLEGVPGVGKTLLAKSLAQALGGHFRRIQCTADLMPSDITGVHVYRQAAGGQGKSDFELIPGPIFGNVVLVDEINRTGPKTQSALLEAMEERQVSIDRKRYQLPDDFFLIASQNPHEFEGTYPLPESQLDRFLMKLDVPYPDAEVEGQILRTYDQPLGGHGMAAAATLVAMPAGALGAARADVKDIQVSDAVYDYAVRLARASRADARVALGLSTRGSLALMRCARVLAALSGRRFVLPDDLKALLAPVLEHRLVLQPEASLEGAAPANVVADLLLQVPAPRAA